MEFRQYEFKYTDNGKTGIHTVYAMSTQSAYATVRKSLGRNAKIEYPEIKPMPAIVTRGGAVY